MPHDPPLRTIADALPYQAAANPDKVALHELAEGDRLVATTFGELKQMVDSFAARLCEAGVQVGRSVALVMPNSKRWIVGYHAIFRLGAVAVPLEYGSLTHQPDRLEYALDHAEADFVLCDEKDVEQVGQLAGAGRHVIAVSSLASPSGSALPEPTVRPADLAQILYTSGTTGPKKGVALTHDNIICDVRMCLERFGLAGDDCIPAVLPYHHAFALTTMVVLPACAGLRALVGDITDRRCRILLREGRPTVLIAVPRVFESILQGIRSSATRAGKLKALERALAIARLVKKLTGVNPGKLLFRRLHNEIFGGTQLRFCMSGGARIPMRVLREFFLLGVPVMQGWGMSELSPVAAAQPFNRFKFWFTRHYERKAGSIGPPLDGTEITLAPDPAEEPPNGPPDRGEMLVKGPHVMQGYYKDPGLSAGQMTPHGLRTGDIARRDADGDLYIIGRAKHVIVLPSGKKVFPEDDLEEDISLCATIEEFAIRPVAEGDAGEKIGIIIRPNVEVLKARGAETVGQLYDAIKKDIDRALRHKPDYMKKYDFCLTAWTGTEYAEPVKTTLGDPSPLKNPFTPETAYSRLRGNADKAPFASPGDAAPSA